MSNCVIRYIMEPNILQCIKEPILEVKLQTEEVGDKEHLCCGSFAGVPPRALSMDRFNWFRIEGLPLRVQVCAEGTKCNICSQAVPLLPLAG